MKRMIRALVCVCFLSVIMSLNVEARSDEKPTFEVQTVDSSAGETVSITISLKNNPGIASIKLRAEYDEGLSLTSVAYNSAMGGSFTMPQKLASPAILLWYNGFANTNGDMIFATLTFKVGESVAVGNYGVRITYDPDDVYNIAEDNIDFAVINGGVNVKGSANASLETAQVIVGSDLTLNVGASVDEGVLAPKARFTGIGRETVVEGTKEGALWKFAFPGIYSQCMTEKIKIEILDGETVLCTREDYSIREYFDSLFNSDASALGLTEAKFSAMRTLLADTLEYGAAAQKYVDYNTYDLANNLSWVMDWKRAFSAPVTDYSVVKNETTTDIIRRATLLLANDVRFKLQLTMTNATKLMISNGITEKTYELSDMIKVGSNYIVTSDGMLAGDFDTVYTFTLSDGTTVYHQMTYSVNSYVAAKCGSTNEKLADIARAIYNYGVSAKVYVE